ncbi:MAG TPA: hypothetical protein VGF55_22975 [Gemmataceae bacterium]|jgi:hypothetical protein
MSLSRRGFLGSAALLGLGGVACADLGAWTRERNHRRVDAAEAKYGRAVAVAGCGFLDCPAFALDDRFRPPQSPYCPQPGDLVFSITKSVIGRIGHAVSGAGEPSHSGYVFRRPDGSLAVMEAGPYDIPVIESRDLAGHLPAYHARGHVWVRPRCAPLTPDQDCRLTEVSAKQEGKPFARLRVYRQVTPFKARGPHRTEALGGPHGPDRRAYYCAELAAEAFVYAGLVPAEDARPSATYPSDLFYDESRDRFLDEHFRLSRFGWGVPSRWRPQMI